MNIILIGPQGSGKGTQAEKIVDHYHLNHLEMGALIREKAHKHDKKSEIIDHLANQKGKLLPDGVVLDMLFEELENISFGNVLFDGFPRTINQYQALKELLVEKQAKIDAAVYIHLTDDEAIKRLLDRGREDDKPESIKQRLSSFHQNTEPILEALKADNIFFQVEGDSSIDQVFERIKSVIDHFLLQNS